MTSLRRNPRNKIISFKDISRDEYFKDEKKSKKKLGIENFLIAASPITVAVICYGITKMPMMLISGTIVSIVCGTLVIVNEKLNNKKTKAKYIPEIKRDYTLRKELTEVLGSKVYSKEYQESFMKESKTKPKSILIPIFDKEDVIEQINNETEYFMNIYDLSSINISDKEWDIYYNSTYNFFDKNNLGDRYYELMSSVNRYVLAKSIADKDKEITINNYIEGLNCIKNDNINFLKEDINNKLIKDKNLCFKR